MNPQDRALWGLRPSAAAAKPKDMAALEDYAVLYRHEALSVVGRFLDAHNETFEGFKAAWKAQRLSTLYHIDFATVARPEAVHIMLREALGMLVETILAWKGGTSQTRRQEVINVLRLEVLAHTFLLYATFQCQVTAVKQRVLLDSATNLALVPSFCDQWIDAMPRAARQARSMLVQMENERAFIKCMHGYTWIHRPAHMSRPILPDDRAIAPPTSDTVGDQAPQSADVPTDPVEPLEFDLTLKHLHDSYQRHMTPFRARKGVTARERRPEVRLANMPEAAEQAKIRDFMATFEKVFEVPSEAVPDLMDDMALETLALDDAAEEPTFDLQTDETAHDRALEQLEADLEAELEAELKAELEAETTGGEAAIDRGLEYSPPDEGLKYNPSDDGRDTAAPPLGGAGIAPPDFVGSPAAAMDEDPRDDDMDKFLSDSSDSDSPAALPTAAVAAPESTDIAAPAGSLDVTAGSSPGLLTAAIASKAAAALPLKDRGELPDSEPPMTPRLQKLDMDAELSLSDSDAPPTTASAAPKRLNVDTALALLKDDGAMPPAPPTFVNMEAALSLSDSSGADPQLLTRRAPVLNENAELSLSESDEAPAPTGERPKAVDVGKATKIDLDAALSLSDSSSSACQQ
ncbi:hypothetical protein ACHHYP_10851 [Achlya hypogyna]|uniref:Uncharacterized protein n=1 Tax=Achlya hypogyna TaxID=1202772 RepID=A0A1V9YKL8_ACHHY|nr:hypothetical protein ACHHYP_10851 [Achlya hypogyna]